MGGGRKEEKREKERMERRKGERKTRTFNSKCHKILDIGILK